MLQQNWVEVIHVHVFIKLKKMSVNLLNFISICLRFWKSLHHIMAALMVSNVGWLWNFASDCLGPNSFGNCFRHVLIP